MIGSKLLWDSRIGATRCAAPMRAMTGLCTEVRSFIGKLGILS